MSNQLTTETTANTSTKLAYERTRVAYERTLMAWVKLGTSLITFGFAVYKFFQVEIKDKIDNESIIGSHYFPLILISVGLLAILLGSYEQKRDLRELRKLYIDMPKSMTTPMAMLVSILGVLAMIAIIYRS